MKINRRQLTASALLGRKAVSAAAQIASAAGGSATITHGPFLGHVTATSIGIWARTARSGSFRVRYGFSPDRLDQLSEPAVTRLDHDNAAWVQLQDLKPGTRYHYRIDGAPAGTFQTHPSPDQFRDPETNPRGLFNFSFAFGSCANQRPGPGLLGPALPAYKTMRDQHAAKLLFSIMNGDWLYEEKRDYTVDEWRKQTGTTRAETPRVVQLAPSIVGVWENYKLYLERGVNLAAWHRDVPGYFTPDDHEILNDVYGTGSKGIDTREALFRDIAVDAWYHYIAGSNPVAASQPIVFGEAELKADSDILYDPTADFTRLDLAAASNLHVHWGGQMAGVVPGQQDRAGSGNPNHGVYDIVSVVDRNRLRIAPLAKANGRAAYSIGRHNYGSFRAGNIEVYLLDTRGERSMHDIDHPDRPGPSMLGARQREWLKSSMARSDADFFFIASTVNLMIPHVGTPGSNAPEKGKDDAWTAFLAEREELIRFWDSLGKPVMVMTGDLHNSWAIKVTDRVWEFASGPHNSQNHPAVSEGNRPPNGPFDSRGRPCEIRWSSYIRQDVPVTMRKWPVYAIAQINNVFPNAKEAGRMRWVAYPKPHVVIQYFDGITGNLLYAEPVHMK